MSGYSNALFRTVAFAYGPLASKVQRRPSRTGSTDRSRRGLALHWHGHDISAPNDCNDILGRQGAPIR